MNHHRTAIHWHVLACITALVLTACASTPDTQTQVAAEPVTGKSIPRVPFKADEYAPYAESGNATVSGSAFLETIHGLKTAKGKQVLLNPVTSYSRQWFEQQYLKGQPLGPRDPRVEKYVLKSKAGEGGAFAFNNVPDGEYYLVAPIVWKEPRKDGSAEVRRQILAKRIVVRGEPVEIMLSR